MKIDRRGLSSASLLVLMMKSAEETLLVTFAEF